ncbi:MAG: PqqD family peptide modification chaperone [bacterium]|nr:PqqD family peptide modification chaperone [bacterium]
MGSRYRVNGPNVVHETVEREAILIHLEYGTYYSLTEAGACVWDVVVRGGDVADAVAAVTAAYDVAPEDAAPVVAALLDTLVAEELVTADDVAPALPLAVAGVADGARRPWSAPELGRFTDMQELLLADPIHEVADAGWPHVKPVAR